MSLFTYIYCLHSIVLVRKHLKLYGNYLVVAYWHLEIEFYFSEIDIKLFEIVFWPFEIKFNCQKLSFCILKLILGCLKSCFGYENVFWPSVNELILSETGCKKLGLVCPELSHKLCLCCLELTLTCLKMSFVCQKLSHVLITQEEIRLNLEFSDEFFFLSLCTFSYSQAFRNMAYGMPSKLKLMSYLGICISIYVMCVFMIYMIVQANAEPYEHPIANQDRSLNASNKRRQPPLVEYVHDVGVAKKGTSWGKIIFFVN